MISGINVIWAYVFDMDRAVGFYRDVLGLSAGYTSPYWSSLKAGEVQIGLHPRDESGDTHEPGGLGWVLCLECGDIAALRARLEAGGYDVNGYHETPNGVLLEFKDTEGNVLQALQPGSKMASFG